MSSMSGSRRWYVLHRRKRKNSRDSTAWFRIWQFQTPAWERYLQLRVLVDGSFFGADTGFLQKGVKSLFNVTNFRLFTRQILFVFTSMVYIIGPWESETSVISFSWTKTVFCKFAIVRFVVWAKQRRWALENKQNTSDFFFFFFFFGLLAFSLAS